MGEKEGGGNGEMSGALIAKEVRREPLGETWWRPILRRCGVSEWCGESRAGGTCGRRGGKVREATKNRQGDTALTGGSGKRARGSRDETGRIGGMSRHALARSSARPRADRVAWPFWDRPEGKRGHVLSWAKEKGQRGKWSKPKGGLERNLNLSLRFEVLSFEFETSFKTLREIEIEI